MLRQMVLQGVLYIATIRANRLMKKAEEAVRKTAQSKEKIMEQSEMVKLVVSQLHEAIQTSSVEVDGLSKNPWMRFLKPFTETIQILSFRVGKSVNVVNSGMEEIYGYKRLIRTKTL